MTQDKMHFSFVLRLWLVPNQTCAAWRCSLENIQTGERRGFATIADLCAFLEAQTDRLTDLDQLQDGVDLN